MLTASFHREEGKLNKKGKSDPRISFQHSLLCSWGLFHAPATTDFLQWQVFLNPDHKLTPLWVALVCYFIIVATKLPSSSRLPCDREAQVQRIILLPSHIMQHCITLALLFHCEDCLSPLSHWSRSSPKTQTIHLSSMDRPSRNAFVLYLYILLVSLDIINRKHMNLKPRSFLVKIIGPISTRVLSQLE